MGSSMLVQRRLKGRQGTKLLSFLSQLWCCQLSMSWQLLLPSLPSGAMFFFVPLNGKGNIDLHGDPSVNHDFLGFSETLGRQQ